MAAAHEGTPLFSPIGPGKVVSRLRVPGVVSEWCDLVTAPLRNGTALLPDQPRATRLGQPVYLVSQGARLLGSLTKGVGTAPVVISVPATDRPGRDTTASLQLQEIGGETRDRALIHPDGPATSGPPTGILFRGF